MLHHKWYWLALVVLCGAGPAGAGFGADEPPKTGPQRDTLLYVRTDPPGAQVLLNGQPLGTSNGLFRVEPGVGSLLVELEGRQPNQRQVLIRAKGVTRVDVKLKPDAVAAAKHVPLRGGLSAAAGQAPFIGRLPQGTVELVGVSNSYEPTVQSRWWQPDGAAAPIGPFRAVQKYRSPRVVADDKPFAFLARFENLPSDASTDPVGGVNPATASPSRGSPNFVPGEGTTEGFPTQFPIRAPSWGPRLWEATAVYYGELAYGDATPNKAGPSPPVASGRADASAYRGVAPAFYRMFSIVFAGSAATTDLRVGVNMGPWETVITWKPASVGPSSFQRDGRTWTVTLQKVPRPRAGPAGESTKVSLASNYTYGQWHKRLVAVANDGSEHAVSIGHNSGGDNGEAVFPGLSWSSITEFRLQVRPYHCVEFDNISLRPGQKTSVKVVSPDELPAQPPAAESTAPENEQAAPAKAAPAKKVAFVIGPSSFPQGDKIVIREVSSTLGSLANGDTVTVKGTYTLKSHATALLAFYVTTDASKGPQYGPGLERKVPAGTVPFEMQRTLTCDGHLHLGFYDLQSGACFGTVYFGTPAQMQEIAHWNLDHRMGQGTRTQ